MIVYFEPPDITPPSAVIKFAKKNNVKLLSNVINIETFPLKNFKDYKGYKKYKAVFTCITDDNICAILYKNVWQIRFATQDELKEIYIDCR